MNILIEDFLEYSWVVNIDYFKEWVDLQGVLEEVCILIREGEFIGGEIVEIEKLFVIIGNKI